MSKHPAFHDTAWREEARKAGGEALVGMLDYLRDGQDAVLEMLQKMQDRHEEFEDKLTKLYGGFPRGDTDGHRRAHELMIEALEEKRRLRIAIQEKTIPGLIWAFVAFLGLCVWNYVQKKLGGG